MIRTATSEAERQPHDSRAATVVVWDRYRVRFAKTGLLRWIGHQDLARLWERMLRRNALQVRMSTGFHPHARISFPSPLALGVEGLDEVVELELCSRVTIDELRDRLIADNQPGLTIGSVRLMAVNGGNGDGTTDSPGLSKATHHQSDFEIEVPEDFDLDAVRCGIGMVETLTEISVIRKDKSVTRDVHEAFSGIELRDRLICVTQSETQGASLKITDLLDAMNLQSLLPSGGIIRRVRLRLVDENTNSPSRAAGG